MDILLLDDRIITPLIDTRLENIRKLFFKKT